MPLPSLSRVNLDHFRSPTDKKSYRLITLSNGLEVVLIQSDTQLFSPRNNTNIDSIDAKDETNEQTSSSSPLAAACLAVNVGSLADPKGLPGLAHYLEHLIFMGSTKYPTEDAFEAFLSAHGGSSNGTTECESTRFLFDVNAAYLAPALDIFANLFVSPLLRREAMEREIKAIESEFQSVRNNNPVRLQQVMCETSVQGHPYSRCFTWGNAESLKHRPERDGIDVQEHIVTLFKTYYVAPRMKLCVYGHESLDILEQYVTQSFNDIPRCRNGYTVPQSEKLVVPYGGGAGHKPTVLRVVPVGEMRSLRLYWMLPAMSDLYRQKPWQYVGHLLGHEGPKSLVSQLRRLKWATDVIAGTSDDDAYEFGSFGTVFEIRVSLTEEGLACWEHVVRVVFNVLHFYSALASQCELPLWLFEELRSSTEIAFRFQEDDNAPVTLCRQLSERMLPHRNVQQTCKGDLLRYDLIQGAFDSTAVCTLLARLSAATVRIVLVAPLLADAINANDLQTEQWFGTTYSVSPIADPLIAFWSPNSDDWMELSPLPAPNVFMPRDFTLLRHESAACIDGDVPPDLLLTTSLTQLWYKQDCTFLVPKASVSFLVMLPCSTPASHMLAELHVELVKHRLQHTLEQAETANFDIELSVRDEAIEIVVSGFSDTLLVLVRTILKEVLRSSSASEIASELTLARAELQREYCNATLSPRAKAYELRLQMLESRVITTDEKLEVLQSKDGRENELADDLARFTATIFDRTESSPVVRCLVMGNISREAAVSLALDIRSVEAKNSAAQPDLEPELELEPKHPSLSPRHHTIALPPTANGLLVRRQSKRIGDRNSVVEVYFQIGKVGPQDRAYAILLRSLLAQPLFHELRTKQQLGYTVTCSIRDTHSVLGLSVSVQSASHATGAVAKELDMFLHETFPREHLLSEEKLSSKSFATHVQTLQRAYAQLDPTLIAQSERYWEEIVCGRLEFDLEARVSKALGKCTREGLISKYYCWLQGSVACCNVGIDNHKTATKSPGPRKLRVHVVGHSSPLKPIEHLLPPEKLPLLITEDLHEFKRKLQCHCHVSR